MADVAGEILKGNLKVVAPGHEAEGGPTGLDEASTRKVEASRAKGDDLEIGGAPNRSKQAISEMIDGIDATIGRQPKVQRVSQRDEGMER